MLNRSSLRAMLSPALLWLLCWGQILEARHLKISKDIARRFALMRPFVVVSSDCLSTKDFEMFSLRVLQIDFRPNCAYHHFAWQRAKELSMYEHFTWYAWTTLYSKNKFKCLSVSMINSGICRPHRWAYMSGIWLKWLHSCSILPVEADHGLLRFSATGQCDSGSGSQRLAITPGVIDYFSIAHKILPPTSNFNCQGKVALSPWNALKKL